MNSRFSKILAALAFGAMTALSAAPALAQQKLIAAQSDIGFTSKQMGVPVEGHFRKFDAQINFDPAKPQASHIAFTIDTGSATVGSRETDSELPKPEWFNVGKFPQASFQSSGVKALGGGRFEVTGKLTIKGGSQDVVVPVQLAANGSNTVASGGFTIKRLTFKIGDGDWSDTSMVADDVQVHFKLTLSGVGKF